MRLKAAMVDAGVYVEFGQLLVDMLDDIAPTSGSGVTDGGRRGES